MTAESGNASLVRLLLDVGADINAAACVEYGRTALQAAVSAAKPIIKTIEILLEAGAYIHAPAAHTRVINYADFPISKRLSHELKLLFDFLGHLLAQDIHDHVLAPDFRTSIISVRPRFRHSFIEERHAAKNHPVKIAL